MSEAERFRQAAEKCDRMADQVTDQKAANGLCEFATEYRRKAQEADLTAQTTWFFPPGSRQLMGLLVFVTLSAPAAIAYQLGPRGHFEAVRASEQGLRATLVQARPSRTERPASGQCTPGSIRPGTCGGMASSRGCVRPARCVNGSWQPLVAR